MARVAGHFPSATLSLTVKFADKVPMPPIGWRDSQGDERCAAIAAYWNKPGPGSAAVTLAEKDWEAACEKWEEAQLLYRSELATLFERRWIFPSGGPGKATIPKGTSTTDSLIPEFRFCTESFG